jgi:chromosome segregation ATPase
MPASPEPSPTDENEFEQAIAETERSLTLLKERYAQVQQDTEQRTELQQRQKQIKQEQRRTRSQELQAELQQIQQQLDTIELNLESRLFTWDSLKEPFWQAVRFGGLGIVVGWILKSCAG